MQKWLHDIRMPRIGIEFDSAMRYTLGGGPQHQLRIIRKPGERYCVDCIQHSDAPKRKDEKHCHCWAAVGYDFKIRYHLLRSAREYKREDVTTGVHWSDSGASCEVMVVRKAKTLYWRRMLIVGMARPRIVVLWANGRRKMAWRISLIVLHFLIFPVLRIVVSLLSNTSRNFHIGMITQQKSWLLRGGIWCRSILLTKSAGLCLRAEM